MGLFRRDLYKEFSKWIDKHLEKEIPKEIIAINFNLYEGSGNTYDVEVIGSNEFDENNEDWACAESFTTRDDLFRINRTKDISEWEHGLEYIKDMVNKYLSEGRHLNKLKVYQAVGIGFVDGNIEILYKNSN